MHQLAAFGSSAIAGITAIEHPNRRANGVVVWRDYGCGSSNGLARVDMLPQLTAILLSDPPRTGDERRPSHVQLHQV